MFSRSARWYDAFYGHKDYAAEAERVTAIINDARPGAASLLDVACGTGRHLDHLRSTFGRCEGIDLDDELLAVARERLPDVLFTRGDMGGFDLGRRFDAVVCLFSSIGYMVTVDRLRAAVAAMARHLEPGGVLVVEPWILPGNWTEPGTTFATVVEDGDRRLVRVVASYRDGDVSRLNMHYVIAEPGRIETADEEHLLGLFSKDDYVDAFRAAGLSPSWDDDGLIGRGLVVGLGPR